MTALRLCYLLIGLLVFQTALASHEAEHLSEPAAQMEWQNTDIFDTDSSNPKVDGEDFCQQCCDCHCCGFVGPLGQPSQPLLYGATDFRVFFYFSVATVYPSAVYRPPIVRV